MVVCVTGITMLHSPLIINNVANDAKYNYTNVFIFIIF